MPTMLTRSMKKKMDQVLQENVEVGVKRLFVPLLLAL
jgi:hypothetical protein